MLIGKHLAKIAKTAVCELVDRVLSARRFDVEGKDRGPGGPQSTMCIGFKRLNITTVIA